MPTPVVLVRSPDRRVITPAEILADSVANSGSPDLQAREALADEVSDKIRWLYGGREPWRQTYAEQLLDEHQGSYGGNGSGFGSNSARQDGWLRPSRYPIEGDPLVWLGTQAISEGIWLVGGQCRHYLYRDPNATGFAAGDRVVPLAHPGRADYRLPKYVAGYVPPGSLGDSWKEATAYAPGESTAYGDAVGSWVRPSDPSGDLLFECTTAGTSDATTEPAWPLAAAEWAPAFPYTALRWVSPRTSTLVFEPTTPGTSDDTEPNWPTAAGQTITDGSTIWTARVSIQITDATVTWTGHPAREFPRTIRKAALLIARIIARINNLGKCDDEEDLMKRIMTKLGKSC